MPFEELLGRRAHVEPGEQQIEDRAGDHRMAHRQPEQRQRRDGDDREGERAAMFIRPTLPWSGRTPPAPVPRKACQQSHR